MNEAAEYVACSCCGKHIADTPEENLDFASRGQDTGYGRCRECFGQPSIKGTDEAAVIADTPLPTEQEWKKRLGWAGRTFYESRFTTLRNALNADNQAKWDKCSYGKKVLIIAGMIEKGAMI